MQHIFNYYYYRYENSKGFFVNRLAPLRYDKRFTNKLSEVELMQRDGRIVIWDRYASRTERPSKVIKACNVLCSPKPINHIMLHEFMQSLSWQVDLRTINVNDYSELFI